MKKHNFFLIIILLSMTLLSAEDFTPFPAPVFVNPDLDNQYFISTGEITGKWVLLNFFATYCEPCIEEFPHLEQVALDYAEEMMVLVVDIDPDGREVVLPYFQENPTALRVLLDPYGKTSQGFNVTGTPVNILIDPEGNVVYRHEGYQSINDINHLRDFLGSKGL